MNKDLVNFIKEDCPKLNPVLASGLPLSDMEFALGYLEENIHSVLAEVAESSGIKFLGLEQVSPLEEFYEMSRGKNNQPRKYNLTRTDAYMVKIKFSLVDSPEVFSKLIRVPFLTKGSIMHINGTAYAVTPVLADRIISVDNGKIFIRLVSVRKNYDCFDYHFNVNGVWNTYPVCKSEIYNNPSNRRAKKFNTDTPILYYLLAYYGLDEFFENYFGFVPIVGRVGKTIDLNDYPEDKYTVVSSFGQKPPRLHIKDYDPCDIVLIFENEDYEKGGHTLRCVLSGLFFILDQFHMEIDPIDFDDCSLWKVCLGKVLFGHDVNKQKLITDINDHLSSVSNYMDKMMIEKFKGIGIEVDTTYDLFFLIIKNFDSWCRKFVHEESNLYEKELTCLYYILNDLISQVVRFIYRLKKKLKHSKLNETDILDALRREIKTDRISQLSEKHGEFSILEYAGDNIALGITKGLTPQEKTTRKKKDNDNSPNLDDPSKFIHPSHLEIRTHLGMSKAEYDGSTVLNLYLDVDYKGSPLRRKELIPIMDEVAQMVRQK